MIQVSEDSGDASLVYATASVIWPTYCMSKLHCFSGRFLMNLDSIGIVQKCNVDQHVQRVLHFDRPMIWLGDQILPVSCLVFISPTT
jgi:hypothetical protein